MGGTPVRSPRHACRRSCGTCSKDEDWSLVSDTSFISNWPHRLWDFTKHYPYIGWSGAYGIGYGAPAAVGAALANRKHDG